MSPFPLRLFGPALLLLSFVPAFAQRIPDTVTPQHYTLTLTPDLKAATFTGSEKIDVTLQQPQDAITLNAAEIRFSSVTAQANGKQLKANVTEDPEKEQATLHFNQTLPAGPATLAIEYTGILNGQLRGFYLSKTAKRNYAVTQFEPTDARRAFPSFDEPAFKATFSVTLIVPKGDTAISNTNIVSDKPGPSADEHAIHFATTPKMSTYLVAFLVGDFQCVSGQSDGVPIRACATPDKVQYGRYALSAAEFVLHYYDQYFGIKYPMPKLDMIALPDFEAGAMENFGAITYRETDLLVDEKTASVEALNRVAQVVAHEMAHQWFGDMVTMNWWNNIWLNEGFATWMENKPVAAWKPEWKVPQDVATQLNATLNLDSQRITRAIRAKADTPDEINQMFDGISYGKAAAVLHMTENYEGEQTFRKGVHNYLQAHMFGNATAEDFWNAQAAASHQPVDKVLSSFVAQPGAPLLTFSQPANGTVQVTQQRFYLNPEIKATEQQTWSIPVCFGAEGAKEHCEILDQAQQSLKVPGSGLFFPDASGVGYYRFALPHQDYTRVVSKIETALTPEERIALLGDEWAGVRSNHDPVGEYLDLAAAVKDDQNAAVMQSATEPLAIIAAQVANTPEEQQKLASWVVRTFKPAYQRLRPSSATDSPDQKELRAALMTVLGNLGHDQDVIAEATRMATQYFKDPASVDATVAQAAGAIAAQNGDAAFFDELQHTFETANNPQIGEFALRLMAEFHNPALERRAMEYAVSGKVRNQDSIMELAIPFRSPETRGVAWDFIRQNWDQVQTQFTTMMGARLVGATSSFCSEDKLGEVMDFFASHKVPASGRALPRVRSAINDCMQLRADQEPKLKQWEAGQ